MSARDDLIAQAKLLEWDRGPTEGFDPEALVNAYAHELAEKIREDSRSPLVQQGGKFHAGELHAADLIDPGVSNGG